MKHIDKIEEIFKTKLKNYEVAPNSWEEFEKKYNNHVKLKKIKWMSFYGIIVSALVISTLIFTTKDKNSPQSTPPIENNIETKHTSKNIQNKKQPNSLEKKDKNPTIIHISKNKKQQNKTNNTYTSKNKTTKTKKEEKNNLQEEITIKNKNENIEHKTKNNSFFYSIEKYIGCVPFSTKIKYKGNNIKAITVLPISDKIQFHNNNTISIYEQGTYFLTIKVTYKDEKVEEYKLQNPIIVYSAPKINVDFINNSTIKIETNSAYNIIATLDNKDTFFNKKTINLDEITPGDHSMIIIAYNKGCSDTIKFDFNKKENITLYMPNAFTPNGDGKNDIFKPVFNKLPETYKLIIYDKSGKPIFVSTDPTFGWNGNGYSSGLYVWKIIYKNNDGKMIEKTGNVTLIKN